MHFFWKWIDGIEYPARRSFRRQTEYAADTSYFVIINIDDITGVRQIYQTHAIDEKWNDKSIYKQ